ncbi:MAG TPA: TadE/TadG family type IV pilus assembly protein [Caulobacter sp.]|nr:TadE/TadG family type IV pilus assembly protein [Caulobacter sp.]
MSTLSRILRRLSEGANAFGGRLRRDQGGAIAIQFALLAIPLSVIVFALVDLGRISLQRRQMQDALDAATLMAARSSATTDAGLEAVGDPAFVAEVAGLNMGLTASNATFKLNGANTVVGTATATLTPIIANLWTNSNFTVTASSEVLRSTSKLEVALVLDNTGSMADTLGSGTKIDALKSAAQSLVTTLAAANGATTDSVKISVVPFASSVNIGSIYQTSGQTGGWLTGTLPPAYGSDVFATSQNRFTLLTNLGLSWGGCVETRPDPYDVTDAGSTSSIGASMFVPYFAPDEPDPGTVPYTTWWGIDYYDPDNNWITSDKTSSSDWFTRQGYVSKYDSNNKTKLTTKAKNGSTTEGPNSGCGTASLLRLTDVTTSTGLNTVNTKLGQMVASGSTNVAVGLMWGWHTLSPYSPFKDGRAYGTTGVKKIIVLLTDGDNNYTTLGNPNASAYTSYGYIWQGRLKNSSGVALGTSSTTTDRRDAIDSRQKLACANAKTAGVIVYSIGVGVSTHSKAILQACATASDYYYDVTDSSQLTAVFTAIANSIGNLRISK